jgi:hypothetical protein
MIGIVCSHQEARMAHALGLEGHAGTHDGECDACARRARANDSWWRRASATAAGWFDRVNGTPVSDIGRDDLGAIRRLAEA